MEKELNIDWKKPVKNKIYVLFALFIFLLGGFVIGFSIGGSIIQNSWEDYNLQLEQKIERDCVCIDGILPYNIRNTTTLNNNKNGIYFNIN